MLVVVIVIVVIVAYGYSGDGAVRCDIKKNETCDSFFLPFLPSFLQCFLAHTKPSLIPSFPGSAICLLFLNIRLIIRILPSESQESYVRHYRREGRKEGRKEGGRRVEKKNIYIYINNITANTFAVNL